MNLSCSTRSSRAASPPLAAPCPSRARLLSEWTTYWWGWDIVHHWMLTGEFIYKLPLLGTWLTWKDPAGRPPCDWWALAEGLGRPPGWRMPTSRVQQLCALRSR